MSDVGERTVRTMKAIAEGGTRPGRPSRADMDRGIAQRIGRRIRAARTSAGLTQSQLAGDRYTKAYVSALENALVKPSMAAINYLADRLGVPVEQLIANAAPRWTRLEADLRLAAGRWQDALDAYGDLLEDDPAATVRPELLAGRAEAEARLGQATDAVRDAAHAAALFRKQGRAADAVRATYWEAYGLYEMELGDQASSLLDRAMTEIAAGLDVDPDLPVRILIALAAVANRDGRPEEALGYLEQARARVPELDDKRRATFLLSLALSYRQLGDLEAAIETGTRSLAHFRAAESRYEVATLENELALVYVALGSLEAARTHAEVARDAFTRLDDTYSLAHVTDTISQVELRAGNAAAAQERATEAAEIAHATGNRKAEISARLSLARAMRANGDLAAAATTLEAAAAVARDLGRRAQLQLVLTEWGAVVAELGDYERAYELSREALQAGRP
ncbi:MAG: hypothetical protein A2V85_07915 [Chloroflexi bacterium RBG_16_72_14]|nr:MAG: hypothetical protein A2V85_07915 [Chloroflexi bacterium RBG_16_72_14]